MSEKERVDWFCPFLGQPAYLMQVGTEEKTRNPAATCVGDACQLWFFRDHYKDGWCAFYNLALLGG